MTITFNCEVCGAEKTTHAAWYKKSKRHVCSHGCAGALPKKQPRKRPEALRRANVTCAHCGMSREVQRYRVRARNFCDVACFAAHNKGKRRGPTDGGMRSIGRKYMKDGYILVKTTAEGGPNGNGYELEHRVIMAAIVGRPLLTSEVVHHKNHDKADNRTANLVIVTYKEHMALHRVNREPKRRCACGRGLRRCRDGSEQDRCGLCRRAA